MAFEWEKMFRRYVSDEIKTPYAVAPEKMTRMQARYEIFAYVLFLGVGFAVIGSASLSGKLPHGDSAGVSIYALFMVWAAVAFGYSKNQMAAAFCATGPVAVLLYFLIYGFHAKQSILDKTVMVTVVVVWLYYSWRIVRIAAHFPSMPDPPDQKITGRRNPYDFWSKGDD
ncbi:MAG: hypothetical protein ACR2PG_00795 [Hyphomicrobiaceae bacterium]